MINGPQQKVPLSNMIIIIQFPFKIHRHVSHDSVGQDLAEGENVEPGNRFGGVQEQAAYQGDGGGSLPKKLTVL